MRVLDAWSALALVATLALTACGTTDRARAPEPTSSPSPVPTSSPSPRPAAGPSADGFGFVLRYGVTKKNELDTVKGTFTKDMVLDPPITVALRLTSGELETIRRRMAEIDVLSYPESYVPRPESGVVAARTPYPSYELRIVWRSGAKSVRWNDQLVTGDRKRERLDDLAALIIEAVTAKPEYRRLPQPRGGYH